MTIEDVNTIIKKELKDRDYFLRVRHLHKGNSSKKQRKGKKYFTIVEIYRPSIVDRPVATGTAGCSALDTPSRKFGYRLALERALVNLAYNYM